MKINTDFEQYVKNQKKYFYIIWNGFHTTLHSPISRTWALDISNVYLFMIEDRYSK